MRKNVTAIVIDDDKDTVGVFCEYLKMFNVSVLGVAYDGKAAVEIHQRVKPDITFLDLMMPEYDGIFALERIRKIDPNARVIMITGDLRSDVEQRLEELKPIRIITKPFNVDEILDVIVDIQKSAETFD